MSQARFHIPALYDPPREPRLEQIERLALGWIFAFGSIAHAALATLRPEAYEGFAGASPIAFIRDQWEAVFVPHALLFGSLLAVFEFAVGIAILSGGRPMVFGSIAAIGFHMALALFGWGFWLWCVPAIAALALLIRAELRRTADARDASSAARAALAVGQRLQQIPDFQETGFHPTDPLPLGAQILGDQEPHADPEKGEPAQSA
jgi:hypothetical protein